MVTPCVQHQVVAGHALEDVAERQEREGDVRPGRSAAKTTSRRRATFETRLPCVSITPLGSPVVPEV